VKKKFCDGKYNSDKCMVVNNAKIVTKSIYIYRLHDVRNIKMHAKFQWKHLRDIADL